MNKYYQSKSFKERMDFYNEYFQVWKESDAFKTMMEAPKMGEGILAQCENQNPPVLLTEEVINEYIDKMLNGKSDF